MLPPIPHLPALPPHPIAASIALMPRLSRLLGLAGLITATLGASWTAPSLAGEKLTQARIANLRNQVNLLNADRSSQPAQLQDLLTPGKGLSTGAASLAELRFNDGSLARVGSQAVFWFVPNTRDLQLSNGTALMLIPPGQGRTRVRTPNVVAGIEGSALVVRFNPETETTSVISLTDSGIQVCMTASGDCQVLEGGQVAAVDADGLQVYQLDLETFYATSGLVEGLDLDVPPTPEELATDPLAAVREETTAVLENLTPLLPDRIVINPASFGPPAAPPADAPALGLLDPRVSFFLFPDQSGGEDVLEALNLVNVNLAGRALLDLEGLQITEDGLVGFNGRTLFELGEIQGQGAFVVTDPTIVTDPTEEPDLGPEQPFCPPGFEIATGKNPNNPNIGRGFDRAAPINCL